MHILPIRIYYEDTDLSGVVYHANYLRYMERGRTEFFRLAGITKMAMLDDAEPTAWTLRSAVARILQARRGWTIRSKCAPTCPLLTGARMQARPEDLHAATPCWCKARSKPASSR